MTPLTAIKTLPSDFLLFRGTATRSEYVYKFLAILVAGVIAYPAFYILVKILGSSGAISHDLSWQMLIIGTPLISLAALAYGIPLTVRRIKDTGVTGWAYLGVIILTTLLTMTWVFGWIALLINIAVVLYCALVPSGTGATFIKETREEYFGKSDDQPSA